MEERSPLELGVVAIEKGAFESLSTKVAKFTYFLFYRVFNNTVDLLTLLGYLNKLSVKTQNMPKTTNDKS